MELKDSLTLEEYEALPANVQIYYERNEDTGMAGVDISLNNVLRRGGYLSTQNRLKNELQELKSSLERYRKIAEKPETLEAQLNKLKEFESRQGEDEGDIDKKINEIRVASEKRMSEELEKQQAAYKQQLSVLETENEAQKDQLSQIKLWEQLTALAPDLKPKYHDIFKASHLNLFTLDENEQLKLSGTDPESLINTPTKKVESIRKEYPEMFLKPKEMEFSPYEQSQTQNRGNAQQASNEFQQALRAGDVEAILAAQARM